MRERSKEYSRLKLRLRLISGTMGLAFLALLILTGWSLRLRAAIPGGPLLQVAGYFTLLLLLWEGVTFPLSFYGGYRVEHRYGLSRESLWGWTWDYLKSLLLSLALGLPLAEGLYWLLREGGESWWLYAAGGAILVGVLMTKLGPVLLAPLFYKFTPLGDEELERALLSLSSRAGVKALGVFRMELGEKSRKAMAGLTGLGRTRRIILSDTLLEGFDRQEIEAVLAHELGHHAGRHMGKTILVHSAFILGTFYLLHRVLSLLPLGFEGRGDVANLPLVLLIFSAVGLLVAPGLNAYSRRLERSCDAFAVKMTAGADPLKRALLKLSDLNLADPEPHPLVEFLFHSHPSIAKRLRHAEECGARLEGGEGALF